MTDHHEGFADEQAYIAHMRHLEALRKQEAKAQGVIKEKRRAIASYSPRIRRAFAHLKSKRFRDKWRMEDPEGFRLKARTNLRRYRARNPEKSRDIARHYYRRMSASFEFMERQRARGRYYHAIHREQRNTKSKAYYVANREMRLAYTSSYREANRDKLRAHDASRFVAHKGSVGSARREEYNAKRRETRARKKAEREQAS